MSEYTYRLCANTARSTYCHYSPEIQQHAQLMRAITCGIYTERLFGEHAAFYTEHY